MADLSRRVFLASSVGVIAGIAAGCSTGESVQVPGGGAGGQGPQGALIAAISGEPDKLDPNSTTSYNSFQVLENVFDTLVEPDENLVMKGALAERWENSPDQLTWTFFLRDGVQWHDGSPFTAKDVVYTYQRLLGQKLSNSWRLSAVTDVSAPDERTVVIKVKSPSPNLLANLGSFKGLAIVQQANVESGAINTKPIGTGPFKLDSYTQGDTIQLSANENYYGGAPKVPGVTFRFISESSTALAALKSGEIQWTDVVPPQQVDALAADRSVVLGQAGSNDYWYLAANEAKAPWRDVKVRQALAFAIDRAAITQAAKYGKATVNQLAIPKSSEFFVEYAPYTTDVAKAKALMAEAGVPNATMQFLATSEYPETVTIGQLLADQLKQIGVTVEIKTVDFSTFLDEQGKGNFDLLMMGWLGNIDPDDFYYGQHHTDGANNYQKYSNPAVDALLEQGRTEIDKAKRKDIYAQAAKTIADEGSYIYLYNPEVIQASSPRLQGYTVRGDRAIRFRTASLS
ncbi:ABC transporter substrate-binding protein [Enemella evansiae]|uniref:ABC transporter substrate-binding protein n=1 Tax=Enemella evansiae TaxID=2016499 RepID=UPI000B963050|nr:ABC transporter substrate-binding protein [Enemella evansiae]OYO20523.1 ABC transporter substrate-binding protein [Enemella evansiae]